MFRALRLQWLARQFARPSGWLGRWLFGAWLDRTSQGMNALVLRLLELGSQDRILEVGFGGGSLFKAILAARPAAAFGVDVSEEMVSRARSRFRHLVTENRARILLGSAECLPIEDGAVDKACSLNNIYFWRDPAAAMKEFARALRPGGVLLLGFEAPETLRAWPGHRYGFTVYEPDEVVGLAAAAGFGDAEVHEGLEPKFGRIFCVKLRRL